MQQIKKKDKLQKTEILLASDYFKLGKVRSYIFINKGNINSNYFIVTDKGKYILRAYSFKTEKEIISELELLQFLSYKKFPCPVPVIAKIYKIGKKNICCFKYINGYEQKHITIPTLRAIAKFLAKLHLLTRDYQMKYKREGEGLSVIKMYIKRNKKNILESKFKDAKKFLNYLESEIDCLYFDDDLPKGVVHVDIKKENIISGNNRQISFIDFDNSYLDAFIIDIGSAIMWLCVEKEVFNIKKVKIFLHEYNSVRKLTKKEESFIIESIKFNCLKQAFKYAYICLPKLKFAERFAYYFIKLHYAAANLKTFY